jgi:4'-phosphopantetheinyl transferase
VGIHSQSGNKPKLVEDNGIHFNVSHSKELIFIAISSADVVGVDVERVSNRSLERLVPRLFSNKEKLEFLNEADKLDFFYRYWTLKESIIKAVGKGHQLKLNEIDIARIRSTGFCYQEYECQFWGNNWESRSYCFGDYRWSISMPHGSMPAVIEIEQNEISNFLGEI